MKTQRINFVIEPNTLEQVRTIANLKGQSLSYVIRKGLTDYVESNKDLLR